jgi:hypothetical protein
MTFANDIEKAAGEDIEAVVIGEMGWQNYGDDERHAPGLARKGELLSWAEARGLLDYPYDTGYGAPDCQAITAWTATKVIWVTQYDGATFLRSAPRHPVPHLPEMPGG